MATPQNNFTSPEQIPVPTDEEALKGKCLDLWKAYHDGTFKYRRQWYLNDNFYEGRHFVWWRRSTGTIDRIEPPKGSVLRAIPKASRQIDSIQNLLTANRPHWAVYPQKNAEGIVDEQMDKIAIKKNEWLDYKFDQLNMDELVGDLVHFALRFPYSFFEIGFDKDIDVAVWDAFDVLFQPDVTSIYQSPVLIKQVKKNLEDIKNNPVYSEGDYKKEVSELKPVFIYSADDMKELRQQEKFGYVRGKQQEYSCLLKEYYYKEYITNPDTGRKEPKIRIVTMANDDKIIRNEQTGLNEYPFVLYSPHSGPLLQPAWIERLIPTNKSLDLIVSNIENFFNLMTKGYWIKHRNANVTRIVNEHGAFIEWDVQEPHQAQLESIPNYVFAHLANLEKWIEEQSVSSVSVGRIPRGIKAYKAIESLKQSDFSNMGIAVTRLETCLEKTAEIMLDLADKYYKTPQTVYRLENEKADYFDVVGASHYIEGSNAIPLRADDKVDVKIETGLSWTEEGKRETLKELYSLGIIPAETVLDAHRFSNVGDMLRKAQAEKQQSMIDTSDFQALSDETKRLILQELMQKNVTMPQYPQPEKMQFRSRERPKGGEYG